jgi:two-component system response regulator
MDVIRKQILLVEDNPDDVELTLRAFRKNNLHNGVHVVNDGVEAIDWLLATDSQPLPAIILLDLKLPRLDGMEVLRQIRATERTRLLPVVILTSSKEETDEARGYQLGANAYVRKPLDFSDFVEASRQLGLYWLVMSDAPPPPAPLQDFRA